MMFTNTVSGVDDEIEGFEYGKLGDIVTDYKPIAKEDVCDLPDNQQLRHAAHGLIFARDNRLLWNKHQTKAMIMMQMRFDGVLGFPGGLVDAGENALEGLNREMQEEIGLDLNQNKFEEQHYLVTHYHEGKKLVLHFYIMEVSPETFCSMERQCLSAHEYGIENLGSIRVPLYTMDDGVRGFPGFLANQFVGNAKDQLIRGLIAARIMTANEVRIAMQAFQDLLVNK